MSILDFQVRIETKVRGFIERTKLSTWYFMVGWGFLLLGTLPFIFTMNHVYGFTLITVSGISLCLAIYLGVTKQ